MTFGIISATTLPPAFRAGGNRSGGWIKRIEPPVWLKNARKLNRIRPRRGFYFRLPVKGRITRARMLYGSGSAQTVPSTPMILMASDFFSPYSPTRINSPLVQVSKLTLNVP